MNGISTASDSERVARSGTTRRVAGLLSVFLLLVSTLPSIGCLSDGDLGPWTALSTSQFGVPLAVGTTTIEVRDIRDGWVERVSVESDGRTMTEGIKLEPLQPAISRAFSDEDAAYLRGDGGEPIPTAGSAIDRAAALNNWVHRRVDRVRYDNPGGSQNDAPSVNPRTLGGKSGRIPDYLQPVPPPRPREGEAPIDSDAACEILRSVAAGARSNCRSYAAVYVDACTLAGLTVRRVDMAVRYGSPHEGHSLVEVWSPELEKWFAVDPFFQAIWTIDGSPASAIQLHRAAVDGRFRSIDFRSTGIGGASLPGSRINPRLYPRNLFVRTASGAWLTRMARAPAPVVDTNILQCDDDAVFAAPPGTVDAYAIRRDSLHGRIAFQAVGGRLVVGLARELFESGRFEARASAGRKLELFDDVAAHDPADPEIADGEELLPETRLTDDDGDGRPDGWTIQQPPMLFEAREDGSALLESDANGAMLSIGPRVSSFDSVVGFAKVSVKTGAVTLSFGGKSQSSPFTVSAGRETTASTAISGSGLREDGLRLELAPDSRVTVAWVSMRNVPKFGELAGASVP